MSDPTPAVVERAREIVAECFGFSPEGLAQHIDEAPRHCGDGIDGACDRDGCHIVGAVAPVVRLLEAAMATERAEREKVEQERNELSEELQLMLDGRDAEVRAAIRPYQARAEAAERRADAAQRQADALAGALAEKDKALLAIAGDYHCFRHVAVNDGLSVGVMECPFTACQMAVAALALTTATRADQRAKDRCPRCDSPEPHLHPAAQHEGEVSVCPDDFHKRVTNRSRPPSEEGR